MRQARLKRFGTWLAIVATLIITVFMLAISQLSGEPFPFRGAELTYEAGVKASLFALASGALFVVSWLPEKRGSAALLARWINRVVLAGTFFLTGWYWLRSAVEVEGDAWGHLSLPLFSTLWFCGFIILGLVVALLISSAVWVIADDVNRRFRDWLN